MVIGVETFDHLAEHAAGADMVTTIAPAALLTPRPIQQVLQPIEAPLMPLISQHCHNVDSLRFRWNPHCHCSGSPADADSYSRVLQMSRNRRPSSPREDCKLAGVRVVPATGGALNGTSSVLYGTVPELAPADKRPRAFGLFYAGTIGAGALSPAIYGLFGDVVLGIPAAMMLIATVVLITLPLAWRLSGLLKSDDVITATRSG